MDRYIGIDVHAQSCTIGVVGPSGKRLKSMVTETNGEALVEAVRMIAGRRHLCLEEGAQSAWLYELLEPHVEEIVVIVPRASKGSKSDARDAWSLAEDLRVGRIETRVYKGLGGFAALREAVRGHLMLVKDVVRVKNRLRAVFRARGVSGVGDDIYDATSRAAWIQKLPLRQRSLAELLGRELDVLEPLREVAEQQLAEEARCFDVVKRLATAPGIGPIRAAQIVAIVVTPDRFRTRRQFWSYCGLAVVTRTSADWVREGTRWVRREQNQTRGLNRNRHPLLKTIFKGAATQIIQHMPRHALHAAYQTMLEAGCKPNLAKLTLARRLAAAVLAMWKHKEGYDPAKHALSKKTA